MTEIIQYVSYCKLEGIRWIHNPLLTPGSACFTPTRRIFFGVFADEKKTSGSACIDASRLIFQSAVPFQIHLVAKKQAGPFFSFYFFTPLYLGNPEASFIGFPCDFNPRSGKTTTPSSKGAFGEFAGFYRWDAKKQSASIDASGSAGFFFVSEHPKKKIRRVGGKQAEPSGF